EGGGDLCASLDVAGAPIEVQECTADAGSLTASMSDVCLDDENGTEITAIPDGNSNVPEGYATLYVLTRGQELLIIDVGGTPSFTVTEGGDYTIHTFVYPEGLDLGVVELGVTTGFDVNSLLIQGGGELCASLDVEGASVTVSDPDAGTLTADQTPVVLEAGSAMISATPNGDIHVPSGYSSVYVLTQGESLTIVNAGGAPEFEVTEAGLYTIHTFVFPSDFDPFSVVTVGETTGVDVLGLITEGGGDLCASLDVAGAPIEVQECTADAGSLKSKLKLSCISDGFASIEAYFKNEPIIPNGYEQLFVLTNAFNLTILNVSETPNFNVDRGGFYRIHTLIYNPQTLDLSIVTPGVTTGFDVNSVLEQGGGDICGALDIKGALFIVLPEWLCRGRNSFSSRGGTDDMLDLDYINNFKSNEDFIDYLNSKKIGSRVFPNPATDKLNINIEPFEDEKFTYILKDINGRVLDKGDLHLQNKKVLEVLRYSRGTYFLMIKSQYRNFVEKIQIKD
ncbi:T9SS type A sorting domain-containing protein, partial [Flavobacteriaceae sp. LMIT009]